MVTVKVKVRQDWFEDDSAKTGWYGNGWNREDGTPVEGCVAVFVTDHDKFSNPTRGEIFEDIS